MLDFGDGDARFDLWCPDGVRRHDVAILEFFRPDRRPWRQRTVLRDHRRGPGGQLGLVANRAREGTLSLDVKPSRTSCGRKLVDCFGASPRAGRFDVFELMRDLIAARPG